MVLKLLLIQIEIIEQNSVCIIVNVKAYVIYKKLSPKYLQSLQKQLFTFQLQYWNL